MVENQRGSALVQTIWALAGLLVIATATLHIVWQLRAFSLLECGGSPPLLRLHQQRSRSDFERSHLRCDTEGAPGSLFNLGLGFEIPNRLSAD
jgi:hypothetical protein